MLFMYAICHLEHSQFKIPRGRRYTGRKKKRTRKNRTATEMEGSEAQIEADKELDENAEQRTGDNEVPGRELSPWSSPQTYIAAGIERVYAAWNLFAQSLGFENLSFMVQPNACCDRETGKMKLIPNEARVAAKSDDPYLLLLPGIGEGENAEIGVRRDSDHEHFVSSGFSDEAYVLLRGFTQDLFKDIERIVITPELYCRAGDSSIWK